MHVAASTDVRLAYKEFLGAVVELCNGEVLSEEFQEVAKTSYNLLTGFGTDFDGSRRIIETKYVFDGYIPVQSCIYFLWSTSV